MRLKTQFAAVVLALFTCAAAHGQLISSTSQSRALPRANAVEYLFPEQIAVALGKPVAVGLHFRVAQGLHVNSHNPSDEFLIPTSFSIPDGAGVRLVGAAYPPGVTIALPADPKTKLNVYTGEFVIQAKIVAAAAGNRLVEAKLRYQACDQSQCMPPRTITVPIDVIAK